MRPACCRTRPDFGLKWLRGCRYFGKLPKLASADNLILEITPSENCKMTDEHGKRMLRELMRFACEPQLDAMTRSWIFDALRNLSGQSLGDDPAQWRAWYETLRGSGAPRINDAHHNLSAAALFQP